MTPLTRRQREVYDYVRAFIDKRGYSPTLEEIGAHFGLTSQGTVHKHIDFLCAKGYLRRGYNISRSLEVMRDDANRLDWLLDYCAGCALTGQTPSIFTRAELDAAMRALEAA